MTNNKVKKLIKKIENHKSSGIPGIKSSLFKITAKILVPQFKFLFNLCLRLSIFPSAWKNTIVTPLYKAGDPSQPGNYRPIACIPLPAKLLEKCIHNQLYDYLESCNLLTDEQFGFRRFRNTQQSIFKFIDNIYQNINSSLSTIAIYVDFRKAFDTVDHQILLEKLKTFNLSNNSVKLFNSYLTDRTQQVFTNKILSKKCLVKTGVPQGGTLGPLLFIMYINSLPNIINNSQTILFADDTVIFHPVSNFDHNYNQIQKDLYHLHLWCRLNLLEINASKTKVMFFSSKHLNSTSKPLRKFKLGLSDLEFVEEYKYLGVTIDSKLSFTKHLKNLISTVSFKISQLRKIRKSLSDKVALQLYKSMILPVMDYSDIFYHHQNAKLVRKLQTLQNRAIRVISRLSRLTNTEDEERKLGLLPLSVRRAQHILLFAFEIRNSMPHLTVLFDDDRNQTKMFTRHYNPDRNQFKMFRPAKTLIQKSISYVLRSTWNALPSQIHQIDDKVTLSRYLINNQHLLNF